MDEFIHNSYTELVFGTNGDREYNDEYEFLSFLNSSYFKALERLDLLCLLSSMNKAGIKLKLPLPVVSYNEHYTSDYFNFKRRIFDSVMHCCGWECVLSIDDNASEVLNNCCLPFSTYMSLPSSVVQVYDKLGVTREHLATYATNELSKKGYNVSDELMDYIASCNYVNLQDLIIYRHTSECDDYFPSNMDYTCDIYGVDTIDMFIAEDGYTYILFKGVYNELCTNYSLSPLNIGNYSSLISMLPCSIQKSCSVT